MQKSLKLLFIPANCSPFYSTMLNDRPLGGTETGIIRVTDQLAKMGHEVYIFQEIEYPKNPNPQGPHYITIREFVNLGDFDAAITVRGWQAAFKDWKAKKNFLWASDAYKSMKTFGLGDKRVSDRLDGLFLLSKWHVDTICKSSGFPREKTWVVTNGIHLEYFQGVEVRHPKRLIYSSAPDRGLIYMPRIYRELKMRHPDLELHVFSSLDKYFPGWSPGYRESENAQLYDQLSGMPGCILHGSILQKGLAREFMKSTLLVYPANFEETSCITAMEAMAAGCGIVTSDLGALRETIQDAGIFIDSIPGTDEYINRFIEETDKLLNHQERIQKLAEAGQKRAKNFTWEHSATTMADYLINFHHLGK